MTLSYIRWFEWTQKATADQSLQPQFCPSLFFLDSLTSHFLQKIHFLIIVIMIITHLSPLELKWAPISLTWDNAMTGPLPEVICSFLWWPVHLGMDQCFPVPLNNGSVFLLVTTWHCRMTSNIIFSFVDVGCGKHSTQTGILRNQLWVWASSAGPGALILLRSLDVKRSP